MKIDTDRLKSVYRDYVRQKTPASLDGCPSPERLLRLLRSRSSDGEATELVDHISRCRYCFSEFGFVLDVLRQEKEFVQELEERRGRPRPRKGIRRKILEWRLGWRHLVPRFSWHGALILAGVVLAGIMIGKYAIFRPSETYRSPTPDVVELLDPVGDEVSGGHLVFRWKKAAGSEYYTLELFDQALERIWQSGNLTEESVVLPQDLAATLRKGRYYFWGVTAYLPNGQKSSSSMERFILKD